MRLHQEALQRAVQTGSSRARYCYLLRAQQRGPLTRRANISYSVWEDNKTSLNFAMSTGFHLMQDNAMTVMWLPKPFPSEAMQVHSICCALCSCRMQISSKLPESVLKPLTWPELVSAVRRSRKDLVPSSFFASPPLCAHLRLSQARSCALTGPSMTSLGTSLRSASTLTATSSTCVIILMLVHTNTRHRRTRAAPPQISHYLGCNHELSDTLTFRARCFLIRLSAAGAFRRKRATHLLIRKYGTRHRVRP